MTPTTPRFNNDLERKSYSDGLAIIAARRANTNTQTQRNLAASRLGVPTATVSAVIRSAVADTLRTFAAKRTAPKAIAPPKAPAPRKLAATPAPAKQPSTVHKFGTDYHRICNTRGLFG